VLTTSFAAYVCLLCILNEERKHRLYAERDIDLLVPLPSETTFETWFDESVRWAGPNGDHGANRRDVNQTPARIPIAMTTSTTPQNSA
jgi:hypothetical protein